MKKSILFSVLVVGATLLQAQSITVHQTCGQNGQVVKAIPPEAAQAVDLGLSVKWANMNVGAESPEDYGNYYAWGETSTKETYNWSTYFDTNDGGNTFTKYNKEGGKTVLDQEDDAAHVNWGGSWRMPTKAECQELIDNCTWTWTRQNGINGYKVTSNKAGYTDKFIFLPAAGSRGDSYLGLVGSYGFYWSSSLCEDRSGYAWGLFFYSDGGSDGHDLDRDGYRFFGQSVRPVLQPSSISYSLSANDTIRIYSNGCDDYQTFIGSHGSQLTMTANSDQWSHFVRWNDGNTDNPRTITTNGNADYTAEFAKYIFSITKNAEHGTISGDSYAEYLDFVTLTVTPDYGYHFTQWSDGLKDNPRIAQITQDTTFTAEFAKNTYSVSTTSTNPEWGTTAGDTAALYLEEVEISAIPYYGYHFVQWNDGSTANPRIVSVTGDKTYTAIFAKNVYSITKNAEHGTISGNSSAEYLDFVTLTVTPDYGYHFTQWSDGLKDNPRIFQITKDTAFTAEFAYDRVGTCGKDLALIWSYDPTNKVLTIGNAGEFTENMQFGVEAPAEMEELVIGNNVTAIGENAFAGISTLKKVTIGESVKTIYDRAFYNCVNLETIFNYRPTPTNAYSTAFDGVDKFECILYVLPNSIDMYKNASVWRDFYYTYAIGATATTVNEVSVTPAVNTAAVAWPAVENAFTYELVIKDKSGNIVCTLVFNANGQLTAIAFAAPGRAQASTQATGFSFTVTGLDSGTGYDLTINAKDDQGQVISTTTQSFTTATDTTTGIDATTDTIPVRKQMINGRLYILRDGKTYTVQGQEVR